MTCPPHSPRPDRRAVLVAGTSLAALGACAAPRMRAETANLSEISSALGDHGARWTPISAAEKRPRLARLAQALQAARLDALLIEPGATLSYLCDVGWGRSERLFALIVLADGAAFWCVPA